MTALPKPSRRAFREVSAEALDEWISSRTLDPAELSFAIEEAGVRGTPRAMHLCLLMLGNGSPLVREGAVYGLATCIERARECLMEAAANDASEGVRAAAKEAVEQQS
jgi:hypothetical protein